MIHAQAKTPEIATLDGFRRKFLLRLYLRCEFFHLTFSSRFISAAVTLGLLQFVSYDLWFSYFLKCFFFLNDVNDLNSAVGSLATSRWVLLVYQEHSFYVT